MVSHRIFQLLSRYRIDNVHTIAHMTDYCCTDKRILDDNPQVMWIFISEEWHFITALI
jgi:hypothetical protein